MPAFALRMVKGPGFDQGSDLAGQPYFRAHVAYVSGLASRGVIIIGGPVDTGDDGDVALLAVEAADAKAARAAFADDPWTVHGVFQVSSAWPWNLTLRSPAVAAAPPEAR
jgi:uncharacterized protein YciI